MRILQNAGVAEDVASSVRARTQALLTSTSTVGGYWAVDDSEGVKRSVFINSEPIEPVNGGISLRDGQFVQVVDRDATAYNVEGHRTITNGLRAFVTGKNDGAGYLYQEKDFHGGWFAAVGNTGGTGGGGGGTRGQSGILASAVQFGVGVATNELAAENPEGSDQAALLSGAFGVARNGVAAADSTHKVYGIAASMCGHTGTAAFRAASVSYAGQPGYAATGLKLGELTVTSAAIEMAASSGNQGTIISYDPNDYTLFDRANNIYSWLSTARAFSI